MQIRVPDAGLAGGGVGWGEVEGARASNLCELGMMSCTGRQRGREGGRASKVARRRTRRGVGRRIAARHGAGFVTRSPVCCPADGRVGRAHENPRGRDPGRGAGRRARVSKGRNHNRNRSCACVRAWARAGEPGGRPGEAGGRCASAPHARTYARRSSSSGRTLGVWTGPGSAPCSRAAARSPAALERRTWALGKMRAVRCEGGAHERRRREGHGRSVVHETASIPGSGRDQARREFDRLGARRTRFAPGRGRFWLLRCDPGASGRSSCGRCPSLTANTT